MIMSLLLFETEFLNIVSISFTALVLNELIMVAAEITTWYAFDLLYHDVSLLIECQSVRHIYMVLSEIITLLIYVVSIVFLPEYFGESRVPSFHLYELKDGVVQTSPSSRLHVSHGKLASL